MYLTKQDWSMFKNFKPAEFRCRCGSCSRSKEAVDMDVSLLFILQTIRNRYGVVEITSGYRCQKWNDKQQGSVKTSYHPKRKAADFYVKGKCDTKEGRQEIIDFIKTLPNFRYAYHNSDGTKPNMGIAIHLDVL